MIRKVPVAEIPPVPSGRSGRVVTRSRLARARVLAAPSMGSEGAELPDLLEAFWGDRADDPNAQDNPVPAAAGVRRLT